MVEGIEKVILIERVEDGEYMDIAKTGEELVKICEENSISLSEYAILREMEDTDLTRGKKLFQKNAKSTRCNEK